MSISKEWRVKTLEVMEYAHAEFCVVTSPPVKVPWIDGFNYRFSEKTVQQAIVQKLARIVTGLRAAQLLIESGFLQEAAMVQRSVDEAHEDAIFLTYGTMTVPPSELHNKFLAKFWSEEPVSGQSLPRPKIREFIAKFEAQILKEPMEAIVNPTKTIYGIYSRYTHANSPNVMELYDGEPPTWQLKGSIGSRLQTDQNEDLYNQYFRGTMAFAISALGFNRPDLHSMLKHFSDDLSGFSHKVRPSIDCK